MKEVTQKFLNVKVQEWLASIKRSDELTVENVGSALCGMNWELATKPFSEAFLCNVAYNGSGSFHAVLWLQLQK